MTVLVRDIKTVLSEVGFAKRQGSEVVTAGITEWSLPHPSHPITLVASFNRHSLSFGAELDKDSYSIFTGAFPAVELPAIREADVAVVRKLVNSLVRVFIEMD
jgi:hypothetical protein